MLTYSTLDIHSASVDDLKAAIRVNSKTYSLMCTEITNLKSVSQRKSTTKNDLKDSPVVICEKPATSVDEDFEDEVDYYYTMVKKLDGVDLKRKLQESLPSKMNCQYNRILLRIRAEIMHNIKSIRDFLEEEDISLEDADVFSSDIELCIRKLQLINELQSNNEVLYENSEDKRNKLILVPTLNGNIRILEDISQMKPEYYERFYGLLKSIENGTFSKVRRFVNKDEFHGLCEVKAFQTRILFKRVDSESYAIIGALIKKTDNDSFYANKVTNLYNNYKNVEESLL